MKLQDKKIIQMGWFKLFSKINLKQLQRWEFRIFPCFYLSGLLSSRLAELKNQIANENTPNKTQESR